MDQNLDWSLFESVNNLKNLFNVVDVSYDLFEFLHNNCPLNNGFNLFDSLIFISDFDDLFILSNNLFDLFDDDWYFDNLFNDVLNVSVDINNLRNDFLNFDNLRNLNNDIIASLNLIYFWNGVGFFYYFFNDLLSSDYLLNDALNWNDLFYDSFYFLDFSLM